MHIGERTIQMLAKLVTGDTKVTPYRSGQKLVRFFNDLGCNDQYPEGGGFPSRWKFAEDKLRELNGSDAIRAVLLRIFDPREYLDFDRPAAEPIEQLNKYLRFDHYEVVLDEDHVKVRSLRGASVELEHPYKESAELTHLFIDEQIQKCEKKIREEDFDGAITNARSLLEAVLVSLERELSQTPEEYDGDLTKLYRRVQKLLKLDPSRKDISESLKQILSGLVSVVTGLSAVRNKLGDAHVTTSRAARHHAKLAVNAAKTLADFLFETKTYQAIRGKHAG